MNSKEKSKFVLNRHYQSRLDSSRNQILSLYDDDLCILDDYNPQQTYEIKLTQQNFTEVSVKRIAGLRWNSLSTLNLEGNKIRAIGCRYLTQTAMPNIQNINLTVNDMASHGVFHLIKANWAELSQLQIEFHCLLLNSVSLLTKGNWPKLSHLKARETKQNEISLQLYWELMTMNNTESLVAVEVGNKKIRVKIFFRNLLHQVRPEIDQKILAQMKKRFVKLPQNYNL